MLFLNCFTPWGPGALYAELYLGLCRALATPWLPPRRLADDRTAPPTRSGPAREASAAEPRAVATAAGPAPAIGAQIIPFERARARLARREA